VGPTMNLISGTHHLCERREYTFMILQEYIIIFPESRDDDYKSFVLLFMFHFILCQSLKGKTKLYTCQVVNLVIGSVDARFYKFVPKSP